MYISKILIQYLMLLTRETCHISVYTLHVTRKKTKECNIPNEVIRDKSNIETKEKGVRIKERKKSRI